MKRVVCFHLFNDYSGSPKVLKLVLEGMLRRGYKIDMVSSKGGPLDELRRYNNYTKFSYSYRFSTNAILTMVRYLFIQLYTFILAFRWVFCKDVVFYVNTLLPIGPAFAGRLMGKHVIYHYHENASAKGAFYKILAFLMQKLAHDIICVSNYQASFLIRKKNVFIVPNALPQEFVSELRPCPNVAFDRQRVLMLGSLKLYKGPLEFIRLAQQLPHYSFDLVVNDTEENISNFIEAHQLTLTKNLSIHPRQNNVVPFYNQSSIVLNLSNKDLVVETFGLTALEAMSASLPVIVPTVGGIAEMVEDGVNGYKIDVQNLNKISECITAMLSDKILYLNLAHKALSVSRNYDETSMIEQIISHLD